MTIYNKSSSVLKKKANDSNIRTKKMNDCKINKLVASMFFCTTGIVQFIDSMLDL